MNLEKELSKAIAKNLNKTIAILSKEQSKMVKEELDISLNKIKKMSRVKKATPYNLQASIITLDSPLSIKHFKKSNHKQGKKIIGVKLKLNKNTQVLLKGHFIARNKDRGGEFVAIRENSKEGKNANFNYKASAKTYPSYSGYTKLLYPLSKKSILQVAKSKSEALHKRAKEIFSKELEL
ncbi:hypothetical protein BKH42_08465 [Helicobacter sp. 13S00482-2]|uniref:hypothetical protein n=1 Tax=Helicobacter sp. 13S00482-2 TaxID=1476200 RepID=UPI000BA734E3|nr:hypothetical protein [Helicobacter sp. 13S00482-2]PAF52961.1 hypothetical protein BKH42_08465 [Helicobacter sp. 13S00482-2]